MDADEYKKLLKKFHKLSDRHILVAEADMSYPDVQKVVNLSDRIRKAGNELKTNDKQKHSEYSNPIIEFYEVEGQMDIFDFLDTEQKKSKDHL